MIIGIDAGALSITDKRLQVGVWRVTLELLKELSYIDKNNLYRLYSFRPIDRKIMSLFGKNMTNVVLSPFIGYMKVRLPMELAVHPVDVFLGVSQALPRTIYSRSTSWRRGIFNSVNICTCMHRKIRMIGFIYDLAFLHMGEHYGSSWIRLREQTKAVIQRADHIITISEFTKNDIISFQEKSISVCYPGITIKKNIAGVKNKHPYILFVGSLKPVKNIPALIQGFHQFMHQSKTEHDLILIGGDYWNDPQIQQTINDLHVGNRVKVVGFMSEEKKAGYYKGADAFITLGKWEGFCLPAVEAMAYGLPIIYADSGALPEVIGNAGIGLDPSDAQEVAEALIKVITDHTSRKKILINGKRNLHRYSWKLFAEKVLHIIDSTYDNCHHSYKK